MVLPVEMGGVGVRGVSCSSGSACMRLCPDSFSLTPGLYEPQYVWIQPSVKPLANHVVQELCESRGGRPGPSVLTSLLVSVDVKEY